MGLTQITTGGVDDNINIDSNTLKVDGTNNRVGIGTASPSANLHIDYESNNPAVFTIENNEGSFKLSANANLGLLDAAQHVFRNAAGSSEYARIDSSGQVGIGTSSPSEKLEVGEVSGAVTSGDLLVKTDSTSAEVIVGRLSSTSDDNTTFKVRDRVDRNVLTVGTSNFIYSQAGSERLRIDSSGNLGLGTASPTGFTGYTVLDINNATNGAIVDLSQGDAMKGRLVATSSSMTTETASGIPIIFSPAGTERVRIDSAGRLLAGTTSTYDGEASNFVVVTTGHTGITVASTGSNKRTNLYFADGTSGTAAYAGGFTYDHSDNSLLVRTASTERMRIDSSGNLRTPEKQDVVFGVDLNTTSGDGGDLTVKSGNGSGSGNDSGNLYLASGRGGSGANSGFIAFGIAKTTNTSGLDSEYARIDTAGRFLVGTASAPNGIHQDANSSFEIYKASGHNMLRVQSDSLSNGQYAMFRAHGNTSGGGSRQVFLGVYKHAAIVNPGPFMLLEAEDGADVYYWTDNSNNFRFSVNNSHIGTTSGAVVGTQTSDLRLKNVGANVSYGLAEVKQLQPKQYALKDDPDVNKLGFIAQEVESIIPEAVFDTNEELDGHEEGDRTKLGMEYVQLIPVLVNAIKELSAEVDTLKTKVAALEAAE